MYELAIQRTKEFFIHVWTVLILRPIMRTMTGPESDRLDVSLELYHKDLDWKKTLHDAQTESVNGTTVTQLHLATAKNLKKPFVDFCVPSFTSFRVHCPCSFLV